MQQIDAYAVNERAATSDAQTGRLENMLAIKGGTVVTKAVGKLVVINDLSRPTGGASALAIASALQVRGRGASVRFICGDDGTHSEMADAGIEITALGETNLMSSSSGKAFVNGLYNRSAGTMMSRWIRQHDTPDTIYHLHGWAQILSPAIFAALRPVKHRLVLSAHDFFLACPNGAFSFLKTGAPCPETPLSLRCVIADCDRRNYTHKLWRVARQIVQKQLYRPRHSPPVLAIHADMRPLLMRCGIPDAAIQTLPNPIAPFSNERIRAEDNRELLFVGRLEHTKGPDLALAAARKAGATLRLIGDGVMRAHLEAAYPEMIFMGRLPPEQIGHHAARARMLLMPSRYPEPFGLVAGEALWSGLPVISNDTAFLASDIVSADAGLACEPRDASAFATQIRSLLGSDERTETMSRNAYDRLPHIGLSITRWIDRLLDAYASRLAVAPPAAS